MQNMCCFIFMVWPIPMHMHSACSLGIVQIADTMQVVGTYCLQRKGTGNININCGSR